MPENSLALTQDESTLIPRASIYRWYVLGILMLVYTTNIADRYLLSALIEPIKAELALSDTAMGFLTGFAFAFFYTFLGFPLAYIADRWNRRTLIVFAVTAYSAMTALCGMAQSYSQLVLVRIGVCVGEAGATPPAHSMIADLLHEINVRLRCLSLLWAQRSGFPPVCILVVWLMSYGGGAMPSSLWPYPALHWQ